MAPLDATRWAALKPHFDRALDLDEAARARWLAELRSHDAALCKELEQLLHHHSAGDDEHFLEGSAIPFPAAATARGQQVGAYALLAPLGQGGMGTVWLAERSDGRFHRRAAIKFLNIALQERGLDRFRREGRIVGRLTHPNIANLIDAGVSASGQPYLVLEYVDGVPIDRYCDQHALDLQARVRLFLDVLAAVAHAHANLIVHRDLKPSNVLVTGDGRVKLLDFGIAKLLDDQSIGDSHPTREGELALTPRFAAPEQLTGSQISTATDIYGLGVLLFVLVTGRHPAGTGDPSTVELIKAIVDTEAPRASTAAADARHRRLLRGDLDTIIATALRKNPSERYASVTAMADDLRRHLNHEPISARTHGIGYRTLKFARRHRWALSAAALIFLTMAGGLYFVNQQRLVAERRFQQLRHLSEQIFSLDNQIKNLSGATAARQALVSVSLAYLEGLSADAGNDDELTLELSGGYWKVGRIQGVPTGLNLGDLKLAESTLQKGAVLAERVLARNPRNPVGHRYAAQIAHDRMIIADTERRDADTLALARKAETHQDSLLQLISPTPLDLDEAATLYSNVGLANMNQNRYEEGVRLAKRQVDVSRQSVDRVSMRHQSQGLSLLASGLRYQGDLEGALKAVREARDISDRVVYTNDNARMFDRYAILMREGLILGEDRAPSLQQPDAALVPLQEAFTTVEAVAKGDPDDSTSRGRAGTIGREIGDILRWRDPVTALTYYDAAINRLGEIRNNVRARRDRAVVLAESSYALRQLNRHAVAQRRLEEARAALEATGDYAASTLEIDDDAAMVVRAFADHLAAVGSIAAARAGYEDLIARVQASSPKVDDDIRQAYGMSLLWESFAKILRAAGENERARGAEEKVKALWQHWDRKLPNNPIVQGRMHLN